MTTFKEYKGVGKVISRYWKNYGGCNTVLNSPYLHVSLIFSAFFFPYSFPEEGKWWDLSIQILPSIIGFSLGGYAIFLAFGDEKFKKLIAFQKEDKTADDTKVSPYLAFSVAFLHFIIVQIVALFLAIAGKNLNLTPGRFLHVEFWGMLYQSASLLIGMLSFAIFIYALSLAVAATFAIYRLVWLYDKHLQSFNDDENGQGS